MPLAVRARLTAPGELSFEEIALPESLDADQVEAETLFSAVSVGTEVAAYAGKPPLREGTPYPRLLGYCNVARVRRVGAAVTRFRPGDRVYTHQSHQSAFQCPEKAVVAALPERLEGKTASLAYLAHLGLASLRKAEVQPGEKVAVLGLGPIGLAAVRLAVLLGARPAAFGNDPGRLALARRMGAEEAVDSTRPEAIETGNGLFDVVVTTVNGWDAWRLALRLTRPHGRVAVLGFPGRGELPPAFNPLDPFLFYARQLSVLSCGMVSEWGMPAGEAERRKGENMAWLLERMAAGELDLSPLVTHVVPWRELETLYRTAVSKDRALVGAVLDWGRDDGA